MMQSRGSNQLSKDCQPICPTLHHQPDSLDLAAIEYSKTPVVLEGMRPSKDKFEAILGGYSHRKNTSVSLVLVRLRFEATFC